MADGLLDNIVFRGMADLATCLCAAIADPANALPPVCFCGIIAGDAPYDVAGGGNCDEDDEDSGCGQAWVRLVTGYPSSSVGIADTEPGNCSKGFGYDIEIGIMRCFPTPDEGEPVDDVEMLAASQLQIADMLVMQQALLCCSSIDNENTVMGQYQPIGPEGTLLGGIWTISILAVN